MLDLESAPVDDVAAVGRRRRRRRVRRRRRAGQRGGPQGHRRPRGRGPARRRRRAGRRSRHYLLVSSMGVEPWPTAPRPEGIDEVFAAYLRAKLAAEEDLLARPRPDHDGPAAGRAHRRAGHRPGDPRPGTSSAAACPATTSPPCCVALLDRRARTARCWSWSAGRRPIAEAVGRAAADSAPAGPGDQRPGGQLVVGRVVDPHQGQPPGRGHRHVAGPLGAARAARPATPADGAPPRRRAARRPGCGPSSGRTRRPTRATVIRSPARAHVEGQQRADRRRALAAAAEGGEVVLARAAGRPRRPSRRRPACAASRRCRPGAAAAARPGRRSAGRRSAGPAR